MEAPKKKYYFEITPDSRIALNLRELISYWELFYFFAWRDIKVKYKQTALGFIWAVIQPFVMMIVFTVFVKGALKITSNDLPYPIFAFSGFLLWNLFSTGISSASVSMLNNANMIKKIYFPRIIIPTSSVIVNVFDFFMGFISFIGLLIFFKQPVNLLDAALYWPISLSITFIAAIGPGCLLAAITVKYRDFRHATPFVLQILLFVSPVIYPLSIVKYEWIKYFIALNPMYAALTFFRAPLVDFSPDWALLGTSITSSIAFLWIGLIYFKRSELYVADLI